MTARTQSHAVAALVAARPLLLVVDGSAPACARYARACAGRYDVVSATTAAEALTCVRQALPSLVLCELGLAGGDALRLIRRLRRDYSAAEMSIVMLTADADDAALVASVAAGADSAIVTPVGDAELVVHIENALARRRADATEVTHWRAVVDEIDHFVWTRDARGQIDWINKRWYAYTGLPRSIPISQLLSRVVPPEDIERAVRAADEGLRDARPFELEFRIKPDGSPDGAYRWMFARSVPAFGPDGAIVRWVGTATDIHDRKVAAERREARLELLAEAIPQIVWQTSPGGRLEYCNSRWTDYTGLSLEETADGGWLTAVHREDRARAAAAWSAALMDAGVFAIEYRIRGTDGMYRWFAVRGEPIRAADGGITCWLGTSTDIDERRRVERAQRFSFEAVALLGRSPDVVPTCKLVAQHAVDLIADFCFMDIRRPNGTIERVAWAHRDPAWRGDMSECVNYAVSPDVSTSGSINRALTDGSVQFIRVWDDSASRRTARNEDHLAFLRRLDISSSIAVPLTGTHETLGVLVFGRAGSGNYFEAADAAALSDVGRRIGLALESANVSERNRAVVDRFQRAALPKSFPPAPGVTFDAIYETAGGSLEVGGDWYDAFALADGSIVLSIGDVTGHGLEAAITMNAVRQSIRTAALYDPEPASIIAIANMALRAQDPGRYVTAFVARLTVETGMLRYASAGHPPPLVRRADGRVEQLSRTAMMLGVDDVALDESAEREVVLTAGDMLVMYTDGLIEAQREIVPALAQLTLLVAGDAIVFAASPATVVRDALLTRPSHDDVAIFIVRLDGPECWSFDALDADAAQGARFSFSRYLERICSTDCDIASAEMIFGELASNVVRYAPGPIEIRLEWHADRAMLHVLDRGPGFVWHGPERPDTYAIHGRGLFIVAALSRAVEVRARSTRGSHVVVELPVTRRQQFPA